MHLSKSPTREQIQTLANLPHGKAEEILVAAGLWDFTHDSRYDVYDVYVTGSAYDEDVDAEGWASVSAMSVEHAIKLTANYRIRDFDWELERGTTVDDMEAVWDLHSIEKQIPSAY